MSEDLQSQFKEEAKRLRSLRQAWFNGRGSKEDMESQARITADLYNRIAREKALAMSVKAPPRISPDRMMRSVDRMIL